MKRTDYFFWKQDALAEAERLQREFCTHLEYANYHGWRVAYCTPAEYLEMLRERGRLA
jgi:guanylate kinase